MADCFFPCGAGGFLGDHFFCEWKIVCEWGLGWTRYGTWNGDGSMLTYSLSPNLVADLAFQPCSARHPALPKGYEGIRDLVIE